MIKCTGTGYPSPSVYWNTTTLHSGHFIKVRYRCMCGSRGDRGSGPPPLKNHKNIGSPSNPLKNHKATKPAFDVGPTSACQRADDGPLIVVFGSFVPSSTIKNKQKKRCRSWTPSGLTFWMRACGCMSRMLVNQTVTKYPCCIPLHARFQKVLTKGNLCYNQKYVLGGSVRGFYHNICFVKEYLK